MNHLIPVPSIIFIFSFIILNMKITLVSSMVFSEEILKSKEYLENKGHFVSIPPDTYEYINGKESSKTLEYRMKTKSGKIPMTL